MSALVARFRRRPVEVEAVQFVAPYKRAQEFFPNLEIIRDGRKVVGGYYNIGRGGDASPWAIGSFGPAITSRP